MCIFTLRFFTLNVMLVIKPLIPYSALYRYDDVWMKYPNYILFFFAVVKTNICCIRSHGLSEYEKTGGVYTNSGR